MNPDVNQARDEAYADLKAKITELMVDVSKQAIEALDRLQASGADIVGDHMDNALQYGTAKEFICAFARALEQGYQHPHPTRADQARIKNYYRLM